jgi:hypothetical protein
MNAIKPYRGPHKIGNAPAMAGAKGQVCCAEGVGRPVETIQNINNLNLGVEL